MAEFLDLESEPSRKPNQEPSHAPFYRNLYFYVICSVVLGILFGWWFPTIGAGMKPLGEGFVNLIKMMIAPIIFCTIVTGIAKTGDMRQTGRVGIKALVYFEIVTTLALLIGLGVGHIQKPGVGVNVDRQALQKEYDKAKQDKKLEAPKSVSEHLLKIIPKTLVSAFVEGEILQVLLVALLFAGALSISGERAKPAVAALEEVSSWLFAMMKIVMWAAPIGAFGAMAFTVGKFGLESLAGLLRLMIGFYLTCFLFIFVVLGLILRLVCQISLWQFLKFIRSEILLVLGTSSSESALPLLMDKLTKLGCSRSVTGIVVPTGYSFNLDGTSIYLTMAMIYLSQALNTPLSFGQQMVLLAWLMLTSKGAAAVTGGGFIVLSATLEMTETLPALGVMLIVGIDRFMSEARAITNLIGNGVATLVVARWEKAWDREIALRALKTK